jgi:hypothetical protein
MRDIFQKNRGAKDMSVSAIQLKEPRRSVWREIGRSWLSMKTWIKVWLFFLNFVFLLALAFLRDPIGSWTFFAYAASGPLLLAMMLWQRGLTRLLGLAHILPWVPLMIYLEARLTSGLAGTRVIASRDPELFSYVILLMTTVGVCLAFDFYDVYRWIRGERFVLGSEEAFRAGASRLAPVA